MDARHRQELNSEVELYSPSPVTRLHDKWGQRTRQHAGAVQMLQAMLLARDVLELGSTISLARGSPQGCIATAGIQECQPLYSLHHAAA